MADPSWKPCPVVAERHRSVQHNAAICLDVPPRIKRAEVFLSRHEKKTDAVLGDDMALFHLFSADRAVHGYASLLAGQVPSLSAIPAK